MKGPPWLPPAGPSPENAGMNDWVLPWARSIAREKMIRSRSRIQQVRTGSSGSGWPRPADSAARAAHGASAAASAASSSARTVPCWTQSRVALTNASSACSSTDVPIGSSLPKPCDSDPGPERAGLLPPQPRVQGHVVEGAVAELGAAQHALAGEAGLLQGALLGHVLHVGAGLDPLHPGVGEQVLGQQPLRLGAEAAVAVLGQQGDADVVGDRAAAGAVLDRVVADVTDQGPVGELDQQVAALLAEHAVLLEAAPQPPGRRVAEPVEAALHLRALPPPLQRVEVLPSHRPQPQPRRFAPRVPRTPGVAGPERAGLRVDHYFDAELASPRAAWPAARRAVGTRNGEQET